VGIVIPIIKIDIECIDLIMVIRFTFSVTSSEQAGMVPFLKSLGLVQTLTFSKLVDFLLLHLQCHLPRNTTRDIADRLAKQFFPTHLTPCCVGNPLGKCHIDAERWFYTRQETPNNIYLMLPFEGVELNVPLMSTSYPTDCS
jgi:hypothetical protein